MTEHKTIRASVTIQLTIMYQLLTETVKITWSSLVSLYTPENDQISSYIYEGMWKTGEPSYRHTISYHLHLEVLTSQVVSFGKTRWIQIHPSACNGDVYKS